MKNFNTGYDPGFVTDVSTDQYPIGLSEEVIRSISFEKLEPDWMLEYRLKAYKHLQTLTPPTWPNLNLPQIDLNSVSYFAKPTKKYNSIEEVPQEILDTFEKLGIPLHERAKLAGVAVDAVFDSVSIATTFQETLKEAGIIFCSISEALHNHSDLVKEYFGKVVPYLDNYYACLNAAVFSDGTFVYIPKGVKAPLELSTYFRINAENLGQFERTLIIADDNSYVSYIEGCTAPRRSEHQLHAAIVELIANSGAEIKYSTVQNWYPGDEHGVGGILNYVTKRGLCSGDDSKITWTQVETGSAITWKYPSCILRGNRSIGEFYSIAVTNNHQQADTGTKMVHIGEGTRSTIISKGISLGQSSSTYRGLVRIANKAQKSRNFTKCDSLVMHKGKAHTVPYIEQYNKSSVVEHEASTSKISEDQLYYLQSRGLSEEDATNLIVTGFCKEIFQKLPLEFAAEAKKLIEYSLSLKYQG